MPGRCGYIPGRGGMPGSGVRTGWEGSGRGPPGVGRAVDPGYGGRFGAPAGRGGIGGAAGRALGTPVCAAAPPAAARVAAGLAGRSVLGAGLGIRGGAVGSGGVGVVGRCSSMRRRSVGGMMRPGAGR